MRHGPCEEYALESLWHEIWHNRQKGAFEVLSLPTLNFPKA